MQISASCDTKGSRPGRGSDVCHTGGGECSVVHNSTSRQMYEGILRTERKQLRTYTRNCSLLYNFNITML